MPRRTGATRMTMRKKSAGLPKWIRGVAAQLGCDPEVALAFARGSPASAYKSPHKDFFEALVSQAEEIFKSGKKIVLLELLAAFPGVLLAPKRRAWVIEELRHFFRDRAYYALALVFGNRVRRKTNLSRAGLLLPKDIPLWMREFRAPQGEKLHVLANQARLQPYVIGEMSYLPFFRKVAGRARKLVGEGQCLVIVEMLDVFPHYLHHLDRFPWIPKALFAAFSMDFRVLHAALRKRLGRKIPSDDDLITNAIAENLLVEFRPTDPLDGRFGHIAPSGLSFSEAVDRLADVKREKVLTSKEKGRRKQILKRIERARKRLKECFGP